jgi:phage terminase Nu1 subunit (DNA packaging protein)
VAANSKGQVVNRTVLADIFGVSLPTIDKWVRDSCPVVTRGGLGKKWAFNTADVAEWKTQRDVAAATGDADTSEEELRLRKLQAETLMAELELAKARGLVAPIREFERAQSAVFAEIRTNCMNIPQRIVTQLLGETDEAVFKKKLRVEIIQALEAAANADLVLPDDADGDDGGD